jgi:hypothetical protein
MQLYRLFVRQQALVFLLFCLYVTTIQQSGHSQTPYFQQDLGYEIDVALDDKAHTLTGKISISYKNNAPTDLYEIRMHLWANAFKQRGTAFDKQKLRGGSTRFYFADEKSLGGYSNLDFQVNGKGVKWKFNPEHPDIAILSLETALQPGGKIIITTPFTVKIPESFSRLGRVGTSYQMTQWYPKPAVYDAAGWHDMPYLDNGEFYSEFGTYLVRLTLPSNYVVGATGTLTTESEQRWLEQKIAESAILLRDTINEKQDSFPPSSTSMKTIAFEAKRVHDFAWFADKRFYVVTDTAVLMNGNRVPCFGMFTSLDANIWKQGAFYVRRAVEFYSNEVGAYPWEHATAVQSALSAGAGMEYPMITVIGDAKGPIDLDGVITHEVGHNWFYGILASNERDHAWQDEGFNTFYEDKYMDKYYGEAAKFEGSLPGFVSKRLNGDALSQVLRCLQANNGNLSVDTHSDAFSSLQYGINSYIKTARLMRWLEQSVGEAKFKTIMQNYYQKWAFKHPQPADFKAVVDAYQLKTDWFFDQITTRGHSDYHVLSVNQVQEGIEVTLKNHGDIASPFPVSALEQGRVVSTRWEDGFLGTKKIFLPCPTATAVAIDYDDQTFDLNRANNYKKARGMLMPRPSLLALAPKMGQRTIGFTPFALWNNYDKTSVGLAIYNPPFPSRKFQYYLLPAYSFASKSMVGVGEVSWRYLPKAKKIQYVQLALAGRTFHMDYNWKFDQYLKFTKWSPSITAHIPRPNRSGGHTYQLKAQFIDVEDLLFDTTGANIGKYKTHWPIYIASYHFEDAVLPNPFTSSFALESQSYNNFAVKASYVKVSGIHAQKFYYNRGRKIEVRLFAGYFLTNTQREKANVHEPSLARGSISLLPQGFADYHYDGMFLGRNEQYGLLARQVEATDGGFKLGHGSSFSGFGYSNDFAFSLNLKADLPKDLPFKLPLKPYFDIGYASDKSLLGSDRTRADQMIWSGGFNLSLFKGGLDIYFPVINSANIRRQYKEVGIKSSELSPIKWNFFHWISWSVNLKTLHPRSVLDKLN